MPYLNKLLNQNLKEFNLIVDIINKNDENIHSAISYRTTEEERKEAKEKLFKVSGWENIFKVLDAFNKYEVDYTCVLNNIDKINKHPR
jgi:GTP-binding protein EngB required for normal cell division